jgi:AraC-like DNA-binding protein
VLLVVHGLRTVARAGPARCSDPDEVLFRAGHGLSWIPPTAKAGAAVVPLLRWPLLAAMHATASRPPRSAAVAHACTDDVPAAERLRYWEAYTASELVGIRCSAYAAEGLRARQRNFDLGGVRLAEITANEHVVERTQPILRSHPKDSVFACLLVEGDAFFYQSGRCIPVHEGDLIIYGTTTPYLYGVTRSMRQVQVDIPSERLIETCPLPAMLAPIRIDGSLRAGRLLTEPLRREMLQFVEAPWADRAPAASRCITSLLEVLIRAHAGDRSGNPDLRLLRAESFIAEHLADPALDAEAVAHHLAMSPRHLNRVFEPHACTATQWIWRQRLAAAHRLLSGGAPASMSIGDVALDCGFSTQAHFAHAFKQAYGVTPSEHRAQSRLDRS